MSRVGSTAYVTMIRLRHRAVRKGRLRSVMPDTPPTSSPNLTTRDLRRVVTAAAVGNASIGVLAPIALLFLRLVQGLCLGGEYGGAISLHVGVSALRIWET